MQKEEKRGLSTIVVTLIIILVSLVAVGVIWIVVRNVIQTGSQQISMGQFSLDAKIMNVNLENNSNNINLTVKRNPGEGGFNSLKFIFYDGKNSEVITQVASLSELEERRFSFHLNILNVSQLMSISIVPVFVQNGKETVGSVLNKYMIAGNEQTQTQPPSSCTPTSCLALGYQCGIWGNGTCSGNLNCGTCGTGYTCNATGSCVSSCTPATCSGLGYTCGTWANGTCAGSLNCGTCGTGYSCNATGRCVASGDLSLVAYYPFNGNANDESGNGNHGTLVRNPVFVTGKIGQGLKFNGTQSVNGMYVTIPDSNSLEGFRALTLCAWVNATSLYTVDANVIIAKTMQSAGAAPFDPYSLYSIALLPGGTYGFSISTGIAGSRVSITSASTVSLNIWHHLCATYNGTTMSLYEDGIKDTNTALTNLVIGSNSIDLRIGAFMASDPIEDIFDGTIDEVRIYNRTLTQAEIISLAGSSQTQDFESVTFPPTGWTTGGNNVWHHNTTEPAFGIAAAGSGYIADSQKTWLTTNYAFSSPGNVSFWWNVSSEAAWDYLCFCVDKACGATGCTCQGTSGTAEARISSSTNGVWTVGNVTYNVATGTHSFTWCYAKDGSTASGDDMGKVDNILFKTS
jgi:hypothetical protein